MKSDWFTGELIRRERGIGSGDQKNVRTTEVPFSSLKAINVPPVTLNGQREIADFLDRETAQIDALIAWQEQLIETLRERRLAAISHAVDGGVGARLVPLRRFVRQIRQGWSPNCLPIPANGTTDWGVLKTGATNGGVFRHQENKALPGDVDPRPELVVRIGEVVMSRASSRELVGSAAAVDESFPKLMLSDLNYGLTFDSKLESDFAIFALMGKRMRGEIESRAKGTSPSMQKLSQRDILELPLWVPAVVEQRRTVTELRAVTSEIDALIAKVEEFIALALERRAALITEVVTGRIDVLTGERR